MQARSRSLFSVLLSFNFSLTICLGTFSDHYEPLYADALTVYRRSSKEQNDGSHFYTKVHPSSNQEFSLVTLNEVRGCQVLCYLKQNSFINCQRFWKHGQVNSQLQEVSHSFLCIVLTRIRLDPKQSISVIFGHRTPKRPFLDLTEFEIVCVALWMITYFPLCNLFPIFYRYFQSKCSDELGSFVLPVRTFAAVDQS